MDKVKYPSTLYAPFTAGRDPDDNMLSWDEYHDLISRPTIITEKRDGENTSVAKTYTHARSLDSNNHPSRNWVKGLWGSISYMIPDDILICGENLYAQHSIPYDDLDSYFEVFSIWLNDYCLPWSETIQLCGPLGLHTVPVLSERRIHTDKEIRAIVASLDTSRQEGIVIRSADGYEREDFGKNLCKWVRKDHITTDDHWMSKPIVPNKLKNRL